jgi:membrane protease YdiL (CAAX protease family)
MRNKFLARSLEATGSISGAIGVTWGTFFLLGGMPLLVAVAWVYVSDPEAAKSYLESPLEFERLGMHRMVFFVLMMLNFVIAMAGLWAGARWIAKQRFFTLISGLDKVRWSRMLGGMLVWLALMAAYSFIQYLISPNSFQNSADAHEVIWWVLPGICLIPIQSAFEELAVRGQLMQAISRRNPSQSIGSPPVYIRYFCHAAWPQHGDRHVWVRAHDVAVPALWPVFGCICLDGRRFGIAHRDPYRQQPVFTLFPVLRRQQPGYPQPLAANDFFPDKRHFRNHPDVFPGVPGLFWQEAAPAAQPPSPTGKINFVRHLFLSGFLDMRCQRRAGYLYYQFQRIQEKVRLPSGTSSAATFRVNQSAAPSPPKRRRVFFVEML